MTLNQLLKGHSPTCTTSLPISTDRSEYEENFSNTHGSWQLNDTERIAATALRLMHVRRCCTRQLLEDQRGCISFTLVKVVSLALC